MPDITIIRGDSYALRRPLFTYTLVDDLGQPFNLAGCTVRTTYKPEIYTIEDDPVDASAPIRHMMVVDINGTVTSSDGLALSGPAANGVVLDRFNSYDTKQIPPDVRHIGDLQLTDANGEIFTWTWVDGLIAVDSVTNRDV